MLAIGWPQGIILALAIMDMTVAMAHDGKTRNAPFTAFNLAVLLGILCWGGFFDQPRHDTSGYADPLRDSTDLM